MDPHVLRAAIQEMIDLLKGDDAEMLDIDMPAYRAIQVGERALLQGIVLGEKK
jgi:hypothetical protein